ncbi:MAG: class I SAM-dependent methyltransferase [Patescibacteria group bacterium]
MRQEYANKILEQSRSGYETIASDFSRTRGTFWQELMFVYDMVPPTSRILDIGCGNGRFLSALKDDTVDYTGVDFSKGLIDIAKERYRERPHATFQTADALALPFSNHSFDIAVSFAVLHHIPSRAYRIQFLKEAARVIKPGSTIILTAWNVWHSRPWTVLKFALKKLLGQTHTDVGDALLDFGKEKNVRFVHALTAREIRSLARGAGLTITRLEKIRRPSGEENFFVVLQA